MPESRLQRTRDAYQEPDVFEKFRREFARQFKAAVSPATEHTTQHWNVIEGDPHEGELFYDASLFCSKP